MPVFVSPRTRYRWRTNPDNEQTPTDRGADAYSAGADTRPWCQLTRSTGLAIVGWRSGYAVLYGAPTQEELTWRTESLRATIPAEYRTTVTPHGPGRMFCAVADEGVTYLHVWLRRWFAPDRITGDIPLETTTYPGVDESPWEKEPSEAEKRRSDGEWTWYETSPEDYPYGTPRSRQSTNRQERARPHTQRVAPPSPAVRNGTEALYAELHLLPTAPPALVKAAYRELARVYHPDTGGDGRTMQRINDAYAKLRKVIGSDPAR